MKKVTKFLTTTLLLASMCTPAFAATPVYTGTEILETRTLTELQSDPNVTFMDDMSIIPTSVESRSTSYTSYIDVGVNASVYGQSRHYDSGSFGTRVYNIEPDAIENSGTLTVKLCTVNALGSYSPIKTSSSKIYPTTTATTFSLGSHNAGNYAFQYSTSGSLALYAKVDMYSK